MNREFRYKYHSSAVKTWIDKIDGKISKDDLLSYLEKSMKSLMPLSQVTVSEVTLSAILDRILYNSSEQYPLLNSIKIDGSTLDFSSFENNLQDLTSDEIREAFHYLITEFFSVIGSITGEQLTPLLYNELSRAKPTNISSKKKKDSP